MQIPVGGPLPEPVLPRRRSLPIAVALALAFAGVTLLAAIAVYIALAGGRDTTIRLLQDRNERIVDAVVERLSSHLDPVRLQVEFLGRMLERGELDVARPERLLDYLAGSLAAVPQVSSISFSTMSLDSLRAERLADGELARTRVNLADLPGVVAFRDELRQANGPYWGELIRIPMLPQPLVNLRMPVRRGGELLGGLVAIVTMGDLSRFVSDAEPVLGASSFILYDREFVLAHPSLVGRAMYQVPRDQVLPRIDQVGDPVLARMWLGQTPSPIDRLATPAGGAHLVRVGGQSYVFVYQQLNGYGVKPWLVGRYFLLSELEGQFEALIDAAMISAGVLVVALLLSIGLGRWISRPVWRLATAADDIRDFNFETPPLPPSRLREIDNAAAAFNSSRGALKWFGIYVPRRLVTRLMNEGDSSMQSKRRALTVMFTDIVGFTPQVESLPEGETAAFLNRHFALIAGCIDEQGGDIDKFIGDAVMATWGAIKKMPDHADRACAAALSIAAAMAAENARRRAEGLAPVRMRIGLHSGSAVIGNIGAPDRINYTVVGDTVNIAQRMEDLGKLYLGPEEDIIILASADTVASLTGRAAFEPLLDPPVTCAVRGRSL